MTKRRIAKNGEPLKFLFDHVSYKGEDCILWPFGVSIDGRGTLCWKGRNTSASRVMCLQAHGEPPSSKHHPVNSCDERLCINPNHLSWKTRREKIDDQKFRGTYVTSGWHGWSKLTMSDIKEIREKFVPRKITYKRLAREYNVSVWTIEQVLAGKYYPR